MRKLGSAAVCLALVVPMGASADHQAKLSVTEMWSVYGSGYQPGVVSYDFNLQFTVERSVVQSASGTTPSVSPSTGSTPTAYGSITYCDLTDFDPCYWANVDAQPAGGATFGPLGDSMTFNGFLQTSAPTVVVPVSIDLRRPASGWVNQPSTELPNAWQDEGDLHANWGTQTSVSRSGYQGSGSVFGQPVTIGWASYWLSARANASVDL